MSVTKTLDKVLNFIPSLPTKLIDATVRGPQALALLPLAALGYVGGWVGQGVATGYIMYQCGATIGQSITGGVVGAMAGPVAKGARFYGA